MKTGQEKETKGTGTKEKKRMGSWGRKRAREMGQGMKVRHGKETGDRKDGNKETGRCEGRGKRDMEVEQEEETEKWDRDTDRSKQIHFA